MRENLTSQDIHTMLDKSADAIPWYCDTRYGYLLCEGGETLYDSDGKAVSYASELELHPFSNDDLILSSYAPDFAQEVVYWRDKVEEKKAHYKEVLSSSEKDSMEYNCAKEALTVLEDLIDGIPQYQGGVVG